MKKINRIFGAILTGGIALAGLGALSSCKSDAKTLQVSTKGLPSPYIEVNKDGSLDGYDIAVVNAAAKKLDYKIKYTVTDEALTGAASGIYDFTVNNWSYNTTRAETYYYSYPYTKPSYDVVFKNGDTVYNTFEEWGTNHLTFASSSQNNTTTAIEKWNEANPDKQVNIKYIEGDIPTLLLALTSGQADFLIFDVAMVAKYQTTYADTFRTLQTEESTDEEVATNISEHLTSHLLFGKQAKKSKTLRDEFSKAIKELKEDGTLLELSKKYFDGADLTPDASDYEAYLN